MPNTVLLILAAGSSSRLGQAKQLLPVSAEQTLLQRLIREAEKSAVDEIVVVLGHAYDQMKTSLQSFPQIHLVINESWSQGMGSSIKAGLQFIEEHMTDWDGVIISVCDQPHLKAEHFSLLMEEGLKHHQPVASQYDKDSYGVPVFFPKSWSKRLLELPDDRGAHFLLKKHKDEIRSLPFPEGLVDIDTPDDWRNWLARDQS